MKFTNYYNKIRLGVKAVPKMRVYPFIVIIIGSLLCVFNVFDRINLSYYMQLFSVCSLILSNAYMIRTKYSMIQIPAFEYNLKLITAFDLKAYVFGKVSLFSLIFIYILSSIFNFGEMTKIVLFLYLMMSMLVSISRRASLKELAFFFFYSSLVLVGFNYLFLWLLYGIVYLFTKFFPLDGELMYTHSLLYSEAFNIQNDTLYKLSNSSSRDLFSPDYVNNITRYYIYKIANLIKFLLLLVVGSLMILILVNLAGYQGYLNEVRLFILFINLTVLLEIITEEDDRLISAKMLSTQMVKRISAGNYLVFFILSSITIICQSIFAMIIKLYVFNLKYVIIALISVGYLTIKHEVLIKFSLLRRYKWIRILVDFVFYAFIFGYM